MTQRAQQVAVFGLGYVGTVTAAGLAAQGHHVVGVDVDDLKVNLIRQGRSPVVEPGVEQMIASGVHAGTLSATTSALEALERADVSLICVGTPSGPLGNTDLVFVKRALADIRDAMEIATPPDSGFHSVVIRSTVPPGTGEEVVAPAFAGELPDGWSVGTAMCPEFLREGSGVEDFYAPPFVVVGSHDERTRRTMEDLFGFLPHDVRHVSVGTAEGLKYACNAFHAAKISFANEMGRILRPHGVDSREVMRVFCEDDKLNISRAYLQPGFAFGGSCLPKDLRALHYLARMNGVDVPLLAGTWQTNELVVRDVVERVIATHERKVCLLGLSFKSDTDDLRESPNVELAERLIGKGFEVQVYDPIIHPDRLVGANRRHVEARLPHLSRLLVRSPEKALDGAGVAIVAHADEDVRQALRANPPRVVLDLHGRLGREVEELAGYEGIGW